MALGVLAGGRDVRATVRAWTVRLLALAVLALAVGIAVREPLARLVGVPDEQVAAAALPATGVLWALLSVQRGALQGLRDFGALGASIVAEGTLRLVVALALVGLGGAVGDVTGAFLAAPVAYLVLCGALAARLDREAAPVDAPPRTSLRSLVRVERWAIIALLGVAVLQNVDTILARRELPEALAGSYASAAVAAKAIVWVAVGLALHLLPEATARAARGEDARGVLLRAFGMVAVLGVPALIIFTAAPTTLLRLAFGDEYTAAPTALPLLGAAMSLLAITLLAVQHLVALGRRAHLPVLAVCALVEIAVLAGQGSSATSFALVVLATQAVAAAITATLALTAPPGGRAPGVSARSTARTTQADRFPLVDGLRALAALAVVAVHAAVFSGLLATHAPWRALTAHLDVGVALFFALSGFLLHRPFLAARHLGTPRVPVGRYARRRVLRILPAHWLALAVLGVAVGLHGVYDRNWWVHFGLLQNYDVATPSAGCVRDSILCGNGPTWTLAIEVAFYVVLPLYAAVVGRLAARAGTRWVAVELGVLGLLGAVSLLIQGLVVHYSPWLFFSPLGRAWWFAVGMALAVLSVRAREEGRLPRPVAALADRPVACWAAAAALYAFLAYVVMVPLPQGAFPVLGRGDYVAQYVVFGLIAGLLLLPVALGDVARGFVPAVLDNRAVRWLGTISYGIFLWHYPVLVALSRTGAYDRVGHARMWVLLAATLVIAIPCAALSFRLLERPLMRLERRRWPSSRPAADEHAAP